MTIKPKLALCLPGSGRFVPKPWAITLACLNYPPVCPRLMLSLDGLPVDEARTQLIDKVLESGAEFSLFLDDDTVPPISIITDLMYVLENSDPTVMACGGIYVTRRQPVFPNVFLGPDKGPHWRWRTGDVFPCWTMGTGAMMVRNEVFRMMEKPWFKWISSADEARLYPEVFGEIPANVQFDCGEDFFFCAKLNASGFHVLAHGGVLPDHYDEHGKVWRLPENSYPLTGGDPPVTSYLTWPNCSEQLLKTNANRQ